ncbi:hypothetical protein [Pseudanabaena sp. SR411]|uniref:hypothetical protein n=1 Tax=Pseudanabaena sp. SR411 TaxID=1980935 RepID=UPI0020CF016D|nr:hypothetical protein [Pseudanabaena sp. SR411]
MPPYSPDLNKIEKFWARLKQHVSKIIGQCESLWDAVQQAFRQMFDAEDNLIWGLEDALLSRYDSLGFDTSYFEFSYA